MKADLHIHTVLSPCGDLEMTPVQIVRMALEKNLDIIGITDHNSTRQAPIIRKYGESQGIAVLMGVEITTSEEAHCLAFFKDEDCLGEFQEYLDIHLPPIPNKPEKFGYQVVVAPDETILYQEEKLLISALDQHIEVIEKKVHSLEGIFIPAHVDKSRFSVLSQLGFIPPGLFYDALELSPHTTPALFLQKYPELKSAVFIRSSDAHFLQDIGKVDTEINIPSFDFEAIRKTLQAGNI